MIQTSPDAIPAKIQSLLGDDCTIIRGTATDLESLKKSSWVLECSDESMKVFHKGQALGKIGRAHV